MLVPLFLWLVLPASLVAVAHNARFTGFCGRLCLIPWFLCPVMPGSLKLVDSLCLVPLFLWLVMPGSLVSLAGLPGSHVSVTGFSWLPSFSGLLCLDPWLLLMVMPG